jgi:hypothetical protein
VSFGPSGSTHGRLELVRAEGLEPPRLSSPEPKSGASANSATPAFGAVVSERALSFGRALYQLAAARQRKKSPRPALRPDHRGDGDGENPRGEQEDGCAIGGLG